MSDKTEEEVQLEAELHAMAELEKAVFETTREAGERLREIGLQKMQKQDRLYQIRSEKVQIDQRKGHATCLKVPKKTAQEDVGLQAQLEALKSENNRMTKELNSLRLTQEKEIREKEDEIEKLTRQRCAREAVKLGAELEVLRTEYEQLKLDHTKHVMELVDSISAAQQIAVETQLRQLEELQSIQSLTEDTRKLKETLLTQHHQHQQHPAAEEHRQGNYFSVWLKLQEAQLSLTNRVMPVCKVVEVLQDFL